MSPDPRYPLGRWKPVSPFDDPEVLEAAAADWRRGVARAAEQRKPDSEAS